MRRPAAHVFVSDLARPVLSPDDAHHLGRALRLRAGELVSATDGQGGQVDCEWAPPGRLQPIAAPAWSVAPVPALTVAFALTKGQHPELAVQKLTEAGVDRIVLLSTARCVARWEPAAQARQLARLAEVARQAAMQSRRTRLPSVEGVMAFSAFAEMAAADGCALACPDGAQPDLSTPTVLVGPEGGWADEELAAVPRHVTLGPHVLRAETAAIAAGLLMAALRTGVVAPARAPAHGQ